MATPVKRTEIKKTRYHSLPTQQNWTSREKLLSATGEPAHQAQRPLWTVPVREYQGTGHCAAAGSGQAQNLMPHLLWFHGRAGVWFSAYCQGC
jgi:hypothetical protein